MNTLTARQLVQAVDRIARHLELVAEEAWIRDCGWRFLFTNSIFAHHLRESPSSLEGRLDRELFSEEQVRIFRRDDGCCVQSALPSFFPEDAPPHRETHATLKFPLTLPSGEIAGVVGIACRMPRPAWLNEPPHWLRRVRRQISIGFAEPVSVRRLAASARVHPDHLGRSFRRHYGMTVHDFVRALRVQWSCWAMLEDPGCRLGEIAVAAGFTDHSHLSREFRRLRGFSPREFRERYGPAQSSRQAGSIPIGLSFDARRPRSRSFLTAPPSLVSRPPTHASSTSIRARFSE